MSTTVTRLTDPVCGMSVRLDAAEQDGLVLDHHGTLYAFCRAACREAFETDPHRYASHAPIASVAPVGTAGEPDIDEGMRRWYDSCSCCLGDAYPDVKAALDAERAEQAQAPAGPGICEVAEGTAPS
ncbi:MAG TPA: YHS domain-containing protein [Candidatus Limnocylindria bacterium]|jgi:YHS domain-containing protein|nr:YHS domain-containing protein [Candidatus Limnocylindria bacterium]